MAKRTMPFAVIGSESVIEVDGKQIRGRKHRWGVVNGKGYASG